MLTVGSLCTGIGLIDLGLEWAGLGPVLWQCEILPERRAVLSHWWPESRIFYDVRAIIERPEYVDVIAFGSPCKNLSSAGDRSGLDGPASSLFWDCLKVVERARPRWVVFENVASGASIWVDRVRGALERLDYETIPVPLAASDLGAPHRRGRVFVIAHTDRDGEPTGAVDAEVAGASTLANLASLGRDQEREPTSHGAALRPRPTSSGWGGSQPDMVRVVHGRADRMDGARQRVAALGDSCVPQCAEVVGHVIRLLSE